MNRRQSTLILVALAVLGLAWATPAQAELVAQWKFDEGFGATVEDASAHGNDGRLKGVRQSWVAGHTDEADDYALRFPATKSTTFVECSDSESFDSIKDEFTIAAWVQERDGSNHGHILVTTSNYRGRDWLLQTDKNNTNSAHVHSSSQRAWNKKSLGFKIPNDEWHHVAVTFDGKEMKAYLDNKLESTHEIGEGQTFPDFSGALYIGGWLVPWSNFIGDIDEMVIFNTVEDVGKIMKGTHPDLK